MPRRENGGKQGEMGIVSCIEQDKADPQDMKLNLDQYWEPMNPKKLYIWIECALLRSVAPYAETVLKTVICAVNNITSGIIKPTSSG